MKKSLNTLLIAAAVCLVATPLVRSNPVNEAQPSVTVELEAATVEPEAEVEPAAAAAAIAVDEEAANAAGVPADVLRLAVNAVTCAVRNGDIDAPPTLTVIDYSRPSTQERLWVFDVRTGALLFSELVAHGRNTGENFATRFSDTLDSRQTSIGLFVTDDTYVGSNGYSLRLDGLEPGFNGRARQRAIVMHGAPYVNETLAAQQGRIGRSWGCPAVREAVARQMIDTVRGGGVIFSYYPDPQWLKESKFLNCGGDTEQA